MSPGLNFLVQEGCRETLDSFAAKEHTGHMRTFSTAFNIFFDGLAAISDPQLKQQDSTSLGLWEQLFRSVRGFVVTIR